MNLVLSPSKISPKVVFMTICDKLLERLKSYDESYTTRLLAPSLFPNYSSTKRTRILERLGYTWNESTNTIHLLHKKVSPKYMLQ